MASRLIVYMLCFVLPPLSPVPLVAPNGIWNASSFQATAVFPGQGRNHCLGMCGASVIVRLGLHMHGLAEFFKDGLERRIGQDPKRIYRLANLPWL